MESELDVSCGIAGLSFGEEQDQNDTRDIFDGLEAAEEADEGPDEMTCAICLEQIPLVDLAMIKGCEHQYCVNCILMWAVCKESCPQCKAPFNYLITYRQLDGTVTDFPSEESVCLLKRARWFEEYVKAKDNGKCAAIFRNGQLEEASGLSHADWADLYEDMLDAELEEDEQIESYYFSSAAGRARVVLGNRRLGEGGYMRAGRVYARPVPCPATPNNSTKQRTKGAGKQQPSATAPAASSSASPSPSGAGPSSSSSSSSSRGGKTKALKNKGNNKPPRASPDFPAANVYGSSPLGRSPSLSRSPGLGGFCMPPPPGSGGTAGTSPGSGAAEPGSGRRAKRAARRQALGAEEDV